MATKTLQDHLKEGKLKPIPEKSSTEESFADLVDLGQPDDNLAATLPTGGLMTIRDLTRDKRAGR